MKIGDLIRKERIRKGLAAAEVARRAAINPDSLASAEASAATLRTMDRVINAMRCRLTWKDRQIAQSLGDGIRVSIGIQSGPPIGVQKGPPLVHG
jgi:transcriptional regulator with XRE-family HTH domain